MGKTIELCSQATLTTTNTKTTKTQHQPDDNDESKPSPLQSDDSKQSLASQPDAAAAATGGAEFVSDSYESSVNVDEIKSDLKQLNLKNQKYGMYASRVASSPSTASSKLMSLPSRVEIEDQDFELTEDLDISAEELEKEINQMIGRNA
jgi:hypothetical protein